MKVLQFAGQNVWNREHNVRQTKANAEREILHYFSSTWNYKVKYLGKRGGPEGEERGREQWRMTVTLYKYEDDKMNPSNMRNS